MFKKILKTLTDAPRERERERESKTLLTLARDFFALERGAGAAGANEEFDPSYITAEHGEDARLGQMRGQKSAFTLAEVLITLAVIGIVAALTIGVFLPKIHSQIRSRQVATAEVKFTKAMEQMALNNAVGPYYDNTQEFVDELQNYLKISKVCSNDKLEDCFGYETIKLEDNKTIDVKDIKTPSTLGLINDDNHEYKDTMGIVTIDGTSMILTWNTKCPILEPKVYQWSGNTNETTNCVSMVLDVNGNSDVNTKGKDVSLFHAEKLGKSCAISFSYEGQDYCWGAPFLAGTPLSSTDCNTIKDKGWLDNCSTSNNDYWAWAVKQCGGKSNMPDRQALADFASYLYNRKFEVSSYVFGGLSWDDRLPDGFPTNYFTLWSGDELPGSTNSTPGFRYFSSDTSTAINYGYYSRATSNWYAVCKL